MKLMKLINVICVNNEIQGHNSTNLLLSDIDSRHGWLCEKGTSKGVVLLEMERATIITAVRIGNAHSAFVEVLVGRLGDATDKFQTLIPCSMFMDMYNSRSGTKPDQVKFFYQKDFCPKVANKEWQVIQVVCKQPFNDQVPFGICFIAITGLCDDLIVAPKSGEDNERPAVSSIFQREVINTVEHEKPSTISEDIKEAGRIFENKMKEFTVKKKTNEELFHKRSPNNHESISTWRKKSLDSHAKIGNIGNSHEEKTKYTSVHLTKYGFRGYQRSEEPERRRKRKCTHRVRLDEKIAKVSEISEVAPIEDVAMLMSLKPTTHSTDVLTLKNQTLDDVYELQTDDEKFVKPDTREFPLPHLPDLFARRSFYIDPYLKCWAQLERYIVAYNGKVTRTIDENVEFYITNSEGPVLQIFRKKAPKLRAVKPGWIWEMSSTLEWVSPWTYMF